MASNFYFYEDGDVIGIVSLDETTGQAYASCDRAATLKLFGSFRDKDLETETDTFEMIPPQYHVAVAYRVLADIIPQKSKYYYQLYSKLVRNIRVNNNRLNHKRQTRNYYY